MSEVPLYYTNPSENNLSYNNNTTILLMWTLCNYTSQTFQRKRYFDVNSKLFVDVYVPRHMDAKNVVCLLTDRPLVYILLGSH